VSNGCTPINFCIDTVCEPLALPVTVDRRETGELETSLFLQYRLFNYTYGSLLTAQHSCRVGSDLSGITAVSVP